MSNQFEALFDNSVYLKLVYPASMSMVQDGISKTATTDSAKKCAYEKRKVKDAEWFQF